MSRSPPQSRDRSMENGLEEEEEETLDDEEDAARLERFVRDRRRARSLPACLLEGRKKSVKFADSLGLSLAKVKHFSAQEEPQIPSKVLSRHRSFPPQQTHDLPPGLLPPGLLPPGLLPPAADRLVACFPELRDAELRARRLRLCLERLLITQFDVRGQVLVPEHRGDGEVGVRYTFNDWLSYVDAQAVPAPGDGARFVFTVYTPPFMDPSSAVHLAVYLKNEQGEFWDNNEGQNYTLRYRCMPGDGQFVSAAFHAT
ncbi:unnamed protein product [Ophioblennius macclurei]